MEKQWYTNARNFAAEPQKKEYPSTRIVAIMNNDDSLRQHKYIINDNSQPKFDYTLSIPLD